MTSAGELSHRISFAKRENVEDPYGNTQSQFVEQFVRSAAVKAKFGGEAVTAARLSGQQPVIITVRQDSSTALVSPDWRARDVREGTEFAIRSIVDPDDSGAFFEILTQTGVAA